MSSILEALRELESQRPPAAQSVAPPAEQPTTVNRAMETLGIASAGLVLGAIGFLMFIGATRVLRTPAPRVPAPVSATDDASAAPARPAWLETADPPRARLGPKAPTAAGPSDAPRPAAAERPPREAKADAPKAARLQVTGIDYASDPSRRSVTLRLDGDTYVTLREHEAARGVEVQLIQPDGVYLRRGAEVFMVAPSP